MYTRSIIKNAHQGLQTVRRLIAAPTKGQRVVLTHDPNTQQPVFTRVRFEITSATKIAIDWSRSRCFPNVFQETGEAVNFAVDLQSGSVTARRDWWQNGACEFCCGGEMPNEGHTFYLGGQTVPHLFRNLGKPYITREAPHTISSIRLLQASLIFLTEPERYPLFSSSPPNQPQLLSYQVFQGEEAIVVREHSAFMTVLQTLRGITTVHLATSLRQHWPPLIAS